MSELSGPMKPSHGQPTHKSARAWLSIVGALVLQEIISYDVKRWPALTLIILILEPIGVIAVFATVSWFMLRQPVYGPSTAVFHATGILPYYFYIRISARTRGFESSAGRRLPCVHPIDEFLALVILEFSVMTAATFLILGALSIFINPIALPFNPGACMGAVLLITMFACGLGLINSAISGVWDFWVTAQIIFNRGMILVSGVFFVMDYMPPAIRDWLMWNPLAHAIIWFRTGVYPKYPQYALDKTYLVFVALCTLVVGFIVERAMQNIETSR